MEVVYIIVAIAAVVAVYFLVFKQPEAPPPVVRRASERPSSQKSAAAEKPRPEDAASPPAGRPEAAPPGGEQDLEPSEISVAEVVAPEPRPSVVHVPDVASLRKGLAKSRGEGGIFGRLRALLGGKKEISPAIAEDIEEILLSSDVGVATTSAILERIRDRLTRGELVDSSKVWEALRAEAFRVLQVGDDDGAFVLRATPTVVLMVGVNGSGKTTTIGKLATRLKAEGRTSVLAAGDTFRAAAVGQLVAWGERTGSTVVRGKDGGDPASVIFEAIKKGKESGAHVVLADTAGRLHTKTNLMAELQKIARTAAKALEGAPHEILLVIDATNGQNALAQAREFKDALPLTGIVLTKLDGTAKGGVILGICDTLKLPVRFIGLGERPDDLRAFSPEEFVEALLGKESEASAA
ncbi:MAG: signal recognition particle-docking protein FtsY [Polyangiaceae bacterium]|nr:signal recognition particle-docking protein FtsY [Polyangiaceae bacterium]